VLAEEMAASCDYTFRGTIDLASIRIWLRHPVP
jgi:hypothetical protein